MFDLFTWVNYFSKKGDFETVEFIKKSYQIQAKEQLSEQYSLILWCLNKLAFGNHECMCPYSNNIYYSAKPKNTELEFDQRNQIAAFLKKIIKIDLTEESLIRNFNDNYKDFDNYHDNYNDDDERELVYNYTPSDYIADYICEKGGVDDLGRERNTEYGKHDFTYLGLPEKYGYKFYPTPTSTTKDKPTPILEVV